MKRKPGDGRVPAKGPEKFREVATVSHQFAALLSTTSVAHAFGNCRTNRDEVITALAQVKSAARTPRSTLLARASTIILVVKLAGLCLP